MATYITLISWTDQGIKAFSKTIDRAEAAGQLAAKFGGNAEADLLDHGRIRPRGRVWRHRTMKARRRTRWPSLRWETCERRPCERSTPRRCARSSPRRPVNARTRRTIGYPRG